MFDSLLGTKFSGKCKHSIKCVKARIVPIKRKKEATLRFLRKDVADLITKGFDTNAFGRIDALIIETNHASCYDMIEQYCECILKQLPSLQKQRRECPQEAVEAVSALIYAAARFSDLPELSDLRHEFTERYGSHMELPKKSEFVQKIQKKSFSIDKKMQLMQQIAQEFSLTWDFKALEQKMSLPPSSSSSQPNQEPPHASNGRKEADTILENEGTPLKGRFKVNPVTDITPKLVQPEPPDIHVVPSFSNDHPHDDSNKTNKVFTDEPGNVKPCCNDAVVPPPYVKPKDVHNGRQKDQPSDGSAKPTVYVEKLQPERRSEIGSNAEQSGNEYTYVRTPRATKDVRLDSWDQEGDTIGPMNRPLYTVPPYLKLKVDNSKHPLLDERRIHGQARSFAAYIAEEQKVEDWNEVERHVNRTPSGRRIHGGRRSTGVAYDADCDEEGSIMDQHITRYGNKRMENESIETVMRSGDARKSCFVAGRAFSLQSESEAMSAGASSMQGDMHSRPPDFDELAARFSALKKDRNQ